MNDDTEKLFDQNYTPRRQDCIRKYEPRLKENNDNINTLLSDKMLQI